ncbi:ATP-binding protein [Streptomyces piniterrae]|uniref:ATP-binding protein n=1 Tax=Streptomyces piniterrae TaxID=2571125 RepID=A0A4U0NQW2_9ACTN|nr:ATP-binding protein [Streptomyces piniterrae]TJZ56853.1 ATP-binding protein [Streptomyces piniterrae]
MTTHPAETVHDALREESHQDTWWLPGPDDFAACALSDSPRTAAEARRFTQLTLEGWRMCPTVTENTALVVSELVSNALRYGAKAQGREDRGDDEQAPHDDDRGGFTPAGSYCPAWLALTRQDTGVLCAVSDAGTGTPVLITPDPLAESGRGLRIVDELSEAWGWTQPDASGKTVWATVSTHG